MAKGGYRPGAGRPIAQHTIQAEKLKAYLIEEVLKEHGPIIKALIDKAKTGDIQAIKEVLERSLGKVKDEMDLRANIKHQLDVPDETYAAIVKRAATFTNKGGTN